jgi:hypothetical protein
MRLEQFDTELKVTTFESPDKVRIVDIGLLCMTDPDGCFEINVSLTCI